jgi:hypothetical protein
MSTNGNFEESYSFGRIAESQIGQWVRINKGFHVLPVYEIEKKTGKGPRLFTGQVLDTLSKELVAPDMLAFRFINGKNDIRWVEAKHKSHFTWHRNSQNWQTGIDLRHYLDYIKVQEQTQWPIWLMFLHEDDKPWTSDLANGSPKTCPTGLFGADLSYLMRHEDHRHKHEKYSRSFPMVYWNHKDLRQWATLDELSPPLQLI